MDAVTAFLQGELHEEIFIDQPEGCENGKKQEVCKLNKAMYGLQQIGREWNKKLESTLKHLGLNKSNVDPSVYFTDELSLIVTIYVDDILIVWSDVTARDITRYHYVDHLK